MFTKNINIEEGFYNGAIGTIKEISEFYIKVEYFNIARSKKEIKNIMRVHNTFNYG